ncbi:tubulin alpha chain-like [Rhodnius prolixus]|uniref:Tubulin alpha chain n=2 Tax=Rhodnius prolixus TaxID=13249 RepID=R4G8G3_RHOPR
MREVISLHLGQAGVQVANTVWELYCLEHGIDETGRLTAEWDNVQNDCQSTIDENNSDVKSSNNDDKKNFPNGEGFSSFFMEMSSGNFTPRAVLVDLEPSVIDQVKSGKYKNLYGPSCLINANEDAANNYARGRYTIGTAALPQIIDPIRKMAESCDKLQGFMFTHSFGGGTGSGLASLLQLELEEEWRKQSKLEVAIFPSPKLSTAVVEPYNAVLTTSATMELSDCVFLVDNEAMYNICQNKLDVDCPAYVNLNRLLAQTISSITASLRFNGTLNADFSDFQTNLVPFPRIHFPIISYAPIVSSNKASHESQSVSEISCKGFDATNRFINCENENGLYIACCLLFRGDVAPKDVNASIALIKKKKEVKFVEWSPSGFKIGINNRPPCCLFEGDIAPTKRALCTLCNTTAIKNAWSAINLKYTLMMAKKAFFHWYTGEGMDEQEFFDAQENIMILENEYKTMSIQ